MGAWGRIGRKVIRGALGTFLLITVAAISPTGAVAATVAVSGDRLEVTGGDERDRLQLERVGEQFRITQRQRDAELATATATCQSTGERELECPSAGINLIKVSTGEGNDRFVVGRSFPASDERGGCRGNELGARLEARMGEGKDYAELSQGDDSVAGGAGKDVLLGCQGDDRIRGGGAGDRLSGDKGNDSIRGSKGSDWLVGCVFDPDDANYPREEPGDDDLRGGRGGDFLYGCKGVDEYRAGDGKDTINARDGKSEMVNCGGRADLVYVDSSDRLRSCERRTNCTTDNFPFFPCSQRASSSRPATR